MSKKITPDEFRDMSVKQIQRTINDQMKKKKKVLYGEMGGGKSPRPKEDIGTIKRNIARGKTIMNEKLDDQVNN